MTKIRVLVVDDSLTVRAKLVEILEGAGLEVVGQAADGQRAIELCVALRPDVMTLDLALPVLDGLAVTEHVMGHAPTPILIVSASYNRGEVISTYAALAAGAVDVLDKARAGEIDWDNRFVSAVRMVSRIPVITHPRAKMRRIAPPPAPAVAPSSRFDVVAIGASTGGPGALVDVLRAVPATFPLPIAIVLHIDAPFARSFADWLGGRIGREVAVAVDDSPIEPGKIVFAPPDRHLVARGGRWRLTDEPPRNHCRPSVDVLFESVAHDRAVAVLLTGMGRDGAAGMLAVRRAGGLTIAQDEASCVVYGMPREAAARGAVVRVLPLDGIGEAIAGAVK